MDIGDHAPVATNQEEMAKIRFVLPSDAWHRVEAEWMWGERVADGIYALRNTPFYAMEISYDDRVKVEQIDGITTFAGVASRSGHSTYRIYAKKTQESPEIQALFAELKELHCSIEGADPKLIAVDVLPEADIYKVYAALQQAERSGQIDFEEGHCGHLLGKGSDSTGSAPLVN